MLNTKVGKWLQICKVIGKWHLKQAYTQNRVKLNVLSTFLLMYLKKQKVVMYLKDKSCGLLVAEVTIGF